MSSRGFFGIPVEALLGQRGLAILAHADFSRTLIPPDGSPGAKEHFTN